MNEELKKNDVHIRKVETIQVAIKAAEKIKGDKTATQATALVEAINAVIKDVSGTYNNREMALVNTKLQEALHWCAEGNVDQVRSKLVEARNWAGEYIKVLS